MNTLLSSRLAHLSKHGPRVILVVALFAVVLAFSAFSFAPTAHAAATTAASPNISLACPPTIAYGSTGQWVKDLQNTLNNDGWRDPNGKKLVVDGIFGSNTLFVVRNFQSIYAPPADGIVGPKTWHALQYC
jgi:peptidoglycan hydrolase-like protein with peptidoglycan-binding domain